MDPLNILRGMDNAQLSLALSAVLTLVLLLVLDII